jgi:hypothetical protein
VRSLLFWWNEKIGRSKRNKSTLEKAEECRDQRPSQNNKTTDEKSPNKSSNKSSLQQEYTKKEEKQLSRGRRKLSLPLSRTNLSFKKRARAKSGESVFLVVGKYHLWYLTLTRTLVVVKEKEIARGARAFFARKAGALFSSGFFFPAEHRIKLVESLLVRFGFGRR